MNTVAQSRRRVNPRRYLGVLGFVNEEPGEALHPVARQLSSHMSDSTSFSRLADEGYTLAMEGDHDGAVTLLLGRLMGCGVGYLSDWLEHDDKRITLWHQGEAPLSICTPGAALAPTVTRDDR